MKPNEHAERGRKTLDDLARERFYSETSATSATNATNATKLHWSDGDTMADNATAPIFLINNLLEVDSHGILAGASMAFKTFVVLRMVYSICTGEDFFGHETFTTGKVMYICGEGKGALARRIKALKMTMGDFNGNLLVLDEHLRIDNDADMKLLHEEIERIKPVLVVFDTFASLSSETDENNPSEVGPVLRRIKETCRCDDLTASMVIHHHGKDASKGMRGASNFTNDVDFAMEVTRATGLMGATMTCKKMKDGEHWEDICMMARVVDLGLERQDGEMSTSIVLEESEAFMEMKQMDRTEYMVLETLTGFIEEHGHAPHRELPGDVKRAVFIDDFRVVIYPLFRNVAKNSLRTTLLRNIKKLEKSGKIMFFNEYLWIP